MTLRLDDAETAELREAAAREGKSMQTFARDAVLAAARNHRQMRDAALALIVVEDAEALARLAEA